MDVQISGSYEPISEAELAQFEKEQGIELPREYRQFFLMHNGGKPKPNKFDVDIGGFKGSSRVQNFLGFHDTEPCTFSKYLATYKDRIPDNLLPIATELSVDLICLSVRGGDYGKVYFWDHDWEVTEGKPDYSNVHLLADSFTEFLDKLYYDEYG